jgi:hypothetical protein
MGPLVLVRGIVNRPRTEFEHPHDAGGIHRVLRASLRLMSTKFLAKLLGLWLLLVAVGIMLNRQSTIDALNAFFSDEALMWITGVFTMLLGLAIVLTHNRWSGGAVAVIVTFYGWAALIKGLLFVWLPLPMQTGFYQALHFEQFSFGYGLVALALGGYLLYGGFKPETGG